MDVTYYESMQVLLAISIMIVAFGVGSFLNRYH